MLPRLTAVIGCSIGKGELSSRLNGMLSHHTDAGKQAPSHPHHPQCQVATVAAAIAHLPCHGSGLSTGNVWTQVQASRKLRPVDCHYPCGQQLAAWGALDGECNKLTCG